MCLVCAVNFLGPVIQELNPPSNLILLRVNLGLNALATDFCWHVGISISWFFSRHWRRSREWLVRIPQKKSIARKHILYAIHYATRTLNVNWFITMMKINIEIQCIIEERFGFQNSTRPLTSCSSSLATLNRRMRGLVLRAREVRTCGTHTQTCRYATLV